jgi:hypothetical protein
MFERYRVQVSTQEPSILTEVSSGISCKRYDSTLNEALSSFFHICFDLLLSNDPNIWRYVDWGIDNVVKKTTILSRLSVTNVRVWVRNRIYSILTGRNHN